MSNYVPSTSLTTRHAPTTTSLLSSTPSQHTTESLPTEARWWSTQFHLGPSSLVPTKATRTSSTRVTFVPTAMGSDIGGGVATSIVNHVGFAPNAVRGHPYQMAVSAGPRVCLYGGSQGGALFRALARVSNRQLSTEQRVDAFRAPSNDADENDEAQDEQVGVKPDRTISTSGVPVYSTAYHSDGRLIALGCDDGTIRVCDSTTRATLRTFSTSGKGGKKARGLPVRTVGWLPDGRKRKGASVSGDEAKKMLWSVGDDAVLRVWDLSGGMCLGGTGNGDVGMGDGARPILEMDGHGDSVRDCVVVNTSAAASAETLLVTGSYDHTVRVWSTHGIYGDAGGAKVEGRRCTSVMDHGAPVECLLAIQPTTTPQHNTSSSKTSTNNNNAYDFPIVLSAGGTTIKLWNPILGKCLSTIHTKHSKTITTLSMASIVREARIGEDHLQPARHDGRIVSRRLISAGLDGLLRIYSADGLFPSYNTDNSGTAGSLSTKHDRRRSRDYTLPYVHGLKTASPITTIALSPCNNQMVIGTTLGTVTVRRRAKFVPLGSTNTGNKRIRKQQPRVGTYSYFMRGQDVKADADDHVVGEGKRKKLRMFEKSLKAFQYGRALDEALKVRDVRGIIAVIEELSRRKGLVTALSNRDEVTLEPLLSFTATNIRVPHHTPVLIGVANILCDIYGDVFGQSEMIDEHFRKLRVHVGNEVRNQKILLGLVGQIDAVMYQAEVGGGE